MPTKLTSRVYRVQKAKIPVKIDANWEKDIWKGVPAVQVDKYMGTVPDHQPRTQAKVLYDDDAIYVIFRVEDRYVRAIAGNFHDSVCHDSCAEFFFTPGNDTAKGYFNFEINCGGTMLVHFQKTACEDRRKLDIADCEMVTIAHTMPKIVAPEIVNPTMWVLEYSIPLAMLEKYSPVTKPTQGVIWKGNFYKCGDKTSHPHWATWAPVGLSKPDFHQPGFFGQLEFD